MVSSHSRKILTERVALGSSIHKHDRSFSQPAGLILEGSKKGNILQKEKKEHVRNQSKCYKPHKKL